jgi:hypothetical protein
LSSTSSPIAEPMNPPARRQLGASGSQPLAIDRHDLRRRLLTALVLAVCVATVLLAVPDLRPVVREIADMNPAVAAAAVALELASCLSFVSIFRLFFRPIPRSGAREMAWSQMGSGALLPGGGVGSLAVGGWLLHVAGMPTRQIVHRQHRSLPAQYRRVRNAQVIQQRDETRAAPDERTAAPLVTSRS